MNYKRTYFKRQTDGSYAPELVEYPPLLDVPVIILGGGGATLTFPIAEGDTCSILFNDRDMDNWIQSGQIGAVASPRLHSFADGIALIGLNSTNNAIEDYDMLHALLSFGAAKLGVSDSKILVKNDTTDLKTVLQNLDSALESFSTALTTFTTGLTTAATAFGGNPGVETAAAAGGAALATASSGLATAASTLNTAIGNVDTLVTQLLE